jgi:hypothetical protein
MREYLGFVPAAVIGVPLAGVMFRDAMGYGGCFDYGPLLVLLPAVALGTILNVAYLVYVGVSFHTSLFDYPSSYQRVIAKCGFAVAVALFLIEAAFWVNARQSG